LPDAAPYRLVLLTQTPRLETSDGELVDLPAGKPLALLAYLHLADEPVPRDTLATLLWPASTRDRARGSVRHALWTLRQRMTEEIFAEDDPVSLAEGILESDVGDLRAALLSGDAEGAAEAWEAGPFGEFLLADAPEWTRWAESLRLELGNRLASGLAEAGKEALDPGRGRGGIDLLEKASRVQPARLQHHVRLVEALLDLRAFGEAGAALARARRHLDDEASVATLNELAARRETLEGGGAGDADQNTLRLDFVGRTEEFASLLRRWREARTGIPSIGLILGDPGVGKTRLAEEIRRMAEAEGGRSVQIKAEDSERPIEWGLLSEVIQRLLRLSGAAGISPASDGILRSLMPSLSLAEPVETDAGVRGLPRPFPRANPSAALSDALIDLVTAVSDDAPLLLVVDDLHWADTESRTVLARVATRLDRASALLLFTCRTAVAEARVRKTLTLLTEAPNATTLELEPWSFAAMAEALEGRIRFSNPSQGGAVLRRIHQTSRGNPLFILELLKVFLEESILVIDAEGDWVFHTDRLAPDLPLPGSVRALVDRQLDQLSREATLVAAHMARIGHSTSPRVLGLQTGLGTSAVTNGIGELLARRMIRWEASDSLIFEHDELRAAVARRYQLHVGLTAGGGAQWSFFRTAVVGTLAVLLLGAALYAITNPDPFGSGPWGGGIIEAEAHDGTRHALRLRSGGGVYLDPTNLSDLAQAGERGDPSDRIRVTGGDDGLHHLHFVRPGSSDGERSTHWIGAVASPPSRTFVAPDLRYVGVLLPGRPDTVRLLAEGGRVMHEAVLPEILDLDWCGANGLMLLSHGARGVELLRWQPREGEPAIVPLPDIIPGGALACSPDDRGLLLSGVREGRPGVFLVDLGLGSARLLSWPGAGAPTSLRWSALAPRMAPVELRLKGAPSLELGLGGQRELEGVLVMSGGVERREPLSWSVDDSTVAIVRPGGRVTARSPGRTTVRARWGGWLEASVALEVTPFVERAPLLELDATPPARGTAPGVAPFDLPEGRGFTVEFEFRAADSGPPVGFCVGQAHGAGEACFTYHPPSTSPLEGGSVSIGTGSGIPNARRDLGNARSDADQPMDEGAAPDDTPLDGLEAGEWRSAALVVGPEGWVSLHVDGERPLTAPARLARPPGEGWVLRLGDPAGRRYSGLGSLRVWTGERRGSDVSPTGG
jgi:DNA-binding SARP family transcriptional activator